jgi:hypothetical protein
VFDPTDLIRIPAEVESRSISFENPTGARGAGGTAHGGRKGAPMAILDPGERVVMADIDGPGVVRHLWLTVPPSPPEVMAARYLEVFYGDASEPSVSVPICDFFGVAWGRPVPTSTALTAIQEGRGFNSFVPMPFHDRIRIEYVNAGDRRGHLYYQVDYTLEPTLPSDVGLLHAAYRRQNPTVLTEDFVIVDDLRGPGRFLGCVVGVRVIDPGLWYGEGEVKIYLDGDGDHPTICGTGLEDYVGTAWGMGPHQALYMGAPLDVRAPGTADGANPDMCSFYRWHVKDPVLFRSDLRVTIQQIGLEMFLRGQEDLMATRQPAGEGLYRPDGGELLGIGLCERVDDYCATAFVMCSRAQPVPRLDVALATADIERTSYESPSRIENELLAAIQ